MGHGSSSQTSPFHLLALDRLEERAEISFTKTHRTAVPLDHLEEQRGAGKHTLCEQLKQVAVVITIDEDLQALQLVLVLLDLSNALIEFGVVVAFGNIEKLLPHPPHFRHRRNDVRRQQRNVLHSGATVAIEIFLNL